MAGIRTVFLPSPASPLCAIRLFFQVGSIDDPKGKEGLAALTSEMVGSGGSKSRTYAELLDALYPLAANIRSYGDKESVVFEGTVHRDNLAKFADLLAEQVLTPRFAEDDFARNKQNALDYVAKSLRGNADEELGKQAMNTVLYKNHPYGYPSQGTVAGLSGLTLDDVRKFFATHYTRDRLIVGVGGGYPAGFAETFAKRFAALPAKAPPLPKLPPAPVYKSNQLLIVEKEARAHAISIGHPLDITRKDPDFYPLTVARSYLGRAPNLQRRAHDAPARAARPQLRRLRLHRKLHPGRLEHLPAAQHPAARATLRALAAPGAAAEQPVRAARRPVRGRQADSRGDPREVASRPRRTFLSNYSNLWAQDVSRRLGYAIDGVVTGKDIVKELQARLPKMKKADVDRAVRKHLSLRASIAIVADKGQAVADTLLSGGPTPIVYDTAGTPPETVAEDDIIKRFPIAIDKADVHVVPVEQMFEK